MKLTFCAIATLLAIGGAARAAETMGELRDKVCAEVNAWGEAAARVSIRTPDHASISFACGDMPSYHRKGRE